MTLPTAFSEWCCLLQPETRPHIIYRIGRQGINARRPFFYTRSPVSFITRYASYSQSKASAIARMSCSWKLSRVILLERFCRVCPVFSASCATVIPRRFKITLIFSPIVRFISITILDAIVYQIVSAVNKKVFKNTKR